MVQERCVVSDDVRAKERREREGGTGEGEGGEEGGVT